MSEPARLGRGVFRAPYRIDGCPVLIAVDSAGERRRELSVRPGSSIVQAAAALRLELDAADPPVRLIV
jgi:hypothetical protein